MTNAAIGSVKFSTTKKHNRLDAEYYLGEATTQEEVRRAEKRLRQAANRLRQIQKARNAAVTIGATLRATGELEPLTPSSETDTDPQNTGK